jgi:hypothetical protein
MCRKLPGLRCAAHARTTAEDARENMETCRAKLQHLIRNADALQRNPVTASEFSHLVDEAQNDNRRAVKAYQASVKEYQLTRTGRKELAEQIIQLNNLGDRGGALRMQQRLDAVTAEATVRNGEYRRVTGKNPDGPENERTHQRVTLPTQSDYVDNVFAAMQLAA